MATEEMVTEQFQLLGIDVQKEVLQNCVSLCEEFQVDAETFVEQWMAFSLTHLNGAVPSLENLALLKRREFSKKREAERLNVIETTRLSTGLGLTVYSALENTQAQSDDGVLSKYMKTGTPKRPKVESDIQPNELHPASYTPTVCNSSRYTTRTNAGAVLNSFGDEKLLENIPEPNTLNDVLNLNISLVPNDDGDVYTKSMFGFELLHEKASIFDSHVQYISQCILKKAGLAGAVSVRHKTQAEVIVCGRIECDADARLNPKSVVLQGTWQESLSQAVPVDIDNLSQYSLFPGQVVVMKGTNPRGDRFIAQQVFHDGAQPIPDYKADILNTLKGTMSMVVAAGPYTTNDNLAYEPLKDLASYINTNKPHVVILTGPFMDSDHIKVKDNSMAETYKSFFDKLIDSLGELHLTSPFTKIYIVSNIKDAFHVNIFPTPPYSSRRKHPNITFVADPSTLNINGVIVGVTSSDVLMQISQEEITKGMGGDKFSRLAGCVLSQQCWSPLWPPPQPTDAALWTAHAQINKPPHLLLLPSNFRYFVKDVNGCIVVNPEHLTKGSGGGTFARLLISNKDDTDLKIAAQIVRI